MTKEDVKQIVKDILEQNGAEITKEDTMGKRKLAYPIKQIFHGYYELCYFTINPEGLEKINHTLRHTQEVLRHIVVQPTPVEEKKPRLTATQENVKEVKTQLPEKPKKEVKEEIQANEVKEEQPVTETEKTQEESSKKPTSQEKVKKEDSSRKKITLEELDKSLDEILKDDMI